ncbi:uncharacterized protein LOC127010829 [Drosophila biarmipes]|uniref:uncharacterized protein LOC127010829 n=1 Tax=Drosophila biarmipes TaxID=125945 RepID=UPI0021CC8A01|nr:uncharacterized protein LOC127010829 [Drosophila biarmipes]
MYFTEKWQFYACIISMILKILTITVYTYVRNLRNTLGKCIISCLFSMVMYELIFTLDYLSFLELNRFTCTRTLHGFLPLAITVGKPSGLSSAMNIDINFCSIVLLPGSRLLAVQDCILCIFIIWRLDP